MTIYAAVGHPHKDCLSN